MQSASVGPRVSPPDLTSPHKSNLDRIHQAIEHAAHLLPAQGPITVFIHHNTLHAFEDLPFDEAVKKGGQVFGCQPYRTEDRYRDDLRRGRIRFNELQEVLGRDLGDRGGQPVGCFGTRFDLRLAMLQYPLRTGPTEELLWHVAEANALHRVRAEVSSAVRSRLIAETRRWVMRDFRRSGDSTPVGPTGPNDPGRRVSERIHQLLDRSGESTIESWDDDHWESFALQALWRVCLDRVRDIPPFYRAEFTGVRHRDLMFDATGEDPDALVHELLIRFTAAFLDQGFAQWPLPRRDEGFYRAFCALYRRPGGPPDRWMRGLGRELARLEDENITPLESIAGSLADLGVDEPEWDRFLSSTLLALRGWAGMVQQVEDRADRVVRPVPEGSLVEFVAVRLILDRFALAEVARESANYQGPLNQLGEHVTAKLAKVEWPAGIAPRAFVVFQLAQLFGLAPDALSRMSRTDWALVVSEIENFTGVERRRTLHLAYEQRFAAQTLDAIALRARGRVGRPPDPRLQVICCLDEREESFRRHLEEIAPATETFGAAGFFSIPMYYKGAADAHYVPLCPVVIRPNHWVVEEVGGNRGKANRHRARTRKVLGAASRRFHLGSRTAAGGAVLTGILGIFAPFPLVGRILFPRLTARIRGAVTRLLRSSTETHLHLERTEPTAPADTLPGQAASSDPDNHPIGFSVAELAEIGERMLRDMGLTSQLARLVVFVGHGSDSQNNPHNSAYNCGACGGAAGGPNARAMAQLYNDPRVRSILADRGLILPDTTWFVGGYHNTCNDSVQFHDLDRLPISHRNDFAAAKRAIDQACDRNAHERCRRFMSAPLTLSFAAARQHVEERAEDLAQTRPELGHATNAITVVGRREWTRGLFLDRRAFLTSYDPSQDDADCSILTRILLAVFPVCAGINLEYYFSNVDNIGFGAGTKLPHNLASLLGVMDGSASDLRTGLPWQMVEIHEPIRSLFVIETTPAAITRIMDRNPMIGRICRNGWVRLATLDPDARTIQVFDRGSFQPYTPEVQSIPEAASSVDWYRGWRDHLEFAEIGATAAQPA